MVMACICNSLPDLAHVPMGGNGLDQKLLATLKEVKAYGTEKWWLYLGKCSSCHQNWLVAQEERIFDEHFLKRLTNEQATGIIKADEWTQEFFTYENVLRTGKKLSTHCKFLDYLAASLIWSAEDLQRDRPDITTDEIAELLGIDRDQAEAVVNAIG